MIQPRSKRVNDLFLTPIILKLECSAVVRGLGRFHWSVVVMFGGRFLCPIFCLLASVLIHLLNIYYYISMASLQQHCATFLLSHCSAEDRFRQVKFLQVLLHQSNILMASQRLLATLERTGGGGLQKKFCYILCRGT